MSDKYRTSQIAKIIGVHPNTIRLYESLNFIPPVEREPNGYRVFTDLHLKQCRLLRLALQVEVVQNGLRKKIVDMIKRSAAGDYGGAITLLRYAECFMKCARATSNDVLMNLTHD